MSNRILVGPAAVLLAAMLVIAGCGGGGGDTEALSKAEFVKRADVICEKADTAQGIGYRKALKESQEEPGGGIQNDLILDAGVPPIQKEVEELAALTPPAGDEDQIQAILEGIEEAIEKTEENPPSALMEGSKNPFTAVNELATEYGFKVCSEAL